MKFRFDESHYRLIFENCGDAILLTALQGRIYRATPAACKMFGRTERELRREGRAGAADLGDPKAALALKGRHMQGGADIYPRRREQILCGVHFVRIYG